MYATSVSDTCILVLHMTVFMQALIVTVTFIHIISSMLVTVNIIFFNFVSTCVYI